MADQDQGTDQSLAQRFNAFAAQAKADKSAPEPESEAKPSAAQPPEQSQEEPTEQPAQEADSDGLVEIELSGKTFKVDPDTAKELTSLKEANLRQADYTKKTQDLADLRRQASIVGEQQRLAEDFKRATEPEQEQIQDLKATLRLYKKLPWSDMSTETHQARSRERDEIKEQLAEAVSTLEAKKAQFAQAQTYKRSDLAKSAYEFVGKKVQGFGPDTEIEKQLARYVVNEGLPEDAFVNGTLAYPPIAVIAWKAMKYDQLLQGKTKAVQAIQKAPPVVRPGATGNASQDKRAAEMRAQFKKSGDFKDAARYLQTLIRKG